MLYVAYGSNMNLEQMEFRCPHSKLIGVGELKGWRLIFNIHADIIRTNNDDDIIPIVLWDIDKRDWRMLDIYEGYPNYYIKKKVNIFYDCFFNRIHTGYPVITGQIPQFIGFYDHSSLEWFEYQDLYLFVQPRLNGQVC